jgi:hypothetical protein
MTEHTPGIWRQDCYTSTISQYPYVYSADNDGNIIGEICRPEAPQTGMMEEAGANARLIAAAPELLDALRALVNCPDYANIRTHEMIAARAAISKAEGV